jgi:signal recognition particle subunit SEC65
MESRQVLAQLAKHGIHIHRETLAKVSDELGLDTRTGTGRTVPRRWSPGQIGILIAHLQATDSDARGPRPLQGLAGADGPFPSREVLAHFRERGFEIHRGRLASISDKLGLQTRVGANSRAPREWTHEQVEAVLDVLQSQLPLQEQRQLQRRRKLTALAKGLLVDAALDLEAAQLQALLGGDPDLTDRFLDQVTVLLQDLLSTASPTEQPNDEGRDTSTEAA